MAGNLKSYEYIQTTYYNPSDNMFQLPESKKKAPVCI